MPYSDSDRGPETLEMADMAEVDSPGLTERTAFARVGESIDWSERSERKEMDSPGFEPDGETVLLVASLLRGLRLA